MTTANKSETSRNGLTVIRSLYVVSWITAAWFFFNGQMADAMSTLGIGLIFDPFDASVEWNKRSRFQKGLLLVHVTLVFVLLGVVMVR